MTIIPTTAMSAPGIFLLSRSLPRITTQTVTATATVPRSAWGISRSVATNCSSVPPDGFGTPSTPASWPIATWMPTPVRKPTRTLRDRKYARNPSLRTRASRRIAATISAASPIIAIHSVDPPTSPSPVSPAAIVIAVAESAATTRCRDEPRIANRKTGIRSV